ncbi:excise, DNA binding domain, excisionase family [uncultured Caudovirales phage]|uniref:Excise, DNA binding domain, excisionase family n=1 Tax=uncultured Caudovirales phage TaxID=2100421 RepID=A0A6J7WQE1_9CAUD|nr:excise, DNA binding domain, excisionase family [uncultured Caudovirales phage]
MILDVDKAAEFLGVSTETIRILARTRKIPAAKVGRLWRFTEEDLINFVRSQYEQSATGSSPDGPKASVPTSMAA